MQKVWLGADLFNVFEQYETLKPNFNQGTYHLGSSFEVEKRSSDFILFVALAIIFLFFKRSCAFFQNFLELSSFECLNLT